MMDAIIAICMSAPEATIVCATILIIAGFVALKD